MEILVRGDPVNHEKSHVKSHKEFQIFQIFELSRNFAHGESTTVGRSFEVMSN